MFRRNSQNHSAPTVFEHMVIPRSEMSGPLAEDFDSIKKAYRAANIFFGLSGTAIIVEISFSQKLSNILLNHSITALTFSIAMTIKYGKEKIEGYNPHTIIIPRLAVCLAAVTPGSLYLVPYVATKLLSKHFVGNKKLDFGKDGEHVALYDKGYIKDNDIILIKHPRSRYAQDQRSISRTFKTILWHMPHRTRFNLSPTLKNQKQNNIAMLMAKAFGLN